MKVNAQVIVNATPFASDYNDRSHSSATKLSFIKPRKSCVGIFSGRRVAKRYVMARSTIQTVGAYVGASDGRCCDSGVGAATNRRQCAALARYAQAQDESGGDNGFVRGRSVGGRTHALRYVLILNLVWKSCDTLFFYCCYTIYFPYDLRCLTNDQ